MTKDEIMDEVRDIINSEGRHHDDGEGREASVYTQDDVEAVTEKITALVMRIANIS